MAEERIQRNRSGVEKRVADARIWLHIDEKARRLEELNGSGWLLDFWNGTSRAQRSPRQASSCATPSKATKRGGCHAWDAPGCRRACRRRPRVRRRKGCGARAAFRHAGAIRNRLLGFRGGNGRKAMRSFLSIPVRGRPRGPGLDGMLYACTSLCRAERLEGQVSRRGRR